MNLKIDVKLLFAFLGVAVIWGTTYLGIRIAVETIPAWYVTTIRQFIATMVLLVILLKQNEFKWVGWQEIKQHFILAVLMVVLANGMTTVAEKTIPSGLTSLINALSPLAIFIASVALGMQKGSLKGFIGVFIGFLGVVFIFRNSFHEFLEPNYRNGIICLAIAVSSWTIGTIYSKKRSAKPHYIFLNLFYQFGIATIIQLVLALIFSGEANVSTWSTPSLLATAYLAVFGSVLGFLCYYYALKKAQAADVSLLTYFNTIIAIFLGWLILNEKVSVDLIVATGLIITGVFITNYKKREVART